MCTFARKASFNRLFILLLEFQSLGAFDFAFGTCIQTAQIEWTFWASSNSTNRFGASGYSADGDSKFGFVGFVWTELGWFRTAIPFEVSGWEFLFLFVSSILYSMCLKYHWFSIVFFWVRNLIFCLIFSSWLWFMFNCGSYCFTLFSLQFAIH